MVQDQGVASAGASEVPSLIYASLKSTDTGACSSLPEITRFEVVLLLDSIATLQGLIKAPTEGLRHQENEDSRSFCIGQILQTVLDLGPDPSGDTQVTAGSQPAPALRGPPPASAPATGAPGPGEPDAVSTRHGQGCPPSPAGTRPCRQHRPRGRPRRGTRGRHYAALPPAGASRGR